MNNCRVKLCKLYFSAVLITSKRCKSNLVTLSYMHNPGNEPLRPSTLGKLIQTTTEKNLDQLALISRSQNKKLTYQELLEKGDKLAASLQTLNLKKGDKIGVWATNSAEWVISLVACVRAGFILVPINLSFQAQELEYCINKVGIKGIICSHKTKRSNLYEILQKLAPELTHTDPGRLKNYKIPSLSTIITIGNEPLKGCYEFREILGRATFSSVKSIKENQHTIPIDSPFCIMFTSGTTGNPKAATISHFQAVNNSYFIGKRNELDTKHHTICAKSPLFHGLGLTISLCSSFNFGSTLVFPAPMYSPRENLKAISDERCTISYGTPTMYVDLINSQKQLNLNLNLETVCTAGAACSPSLFKQMKKFLNIKKVKSLYGLTEATGATFHSLPIEEEDETATTTVGCIGDHLEVKVVDENNNIVPLGTPGELCIRGYNVMLGYWNDKEKTKQILDWDNWLKTGDQFVLQENGYGRVVGRLKDMIIRGGENIYPKEIEDFLNTHPNIKEAHVIGLKHDRLGEEVCACVRLQKGTHLTLELLIEFCKGNIADYKIPSRLEVIANLPKTLSGKIQKYLLKKQLEQ